MNASEILIIDDEKLLLSALSRAFQREGFSVFTVSSGTAALFEIEKRKSPFAAALVDLLMPDMAGVQLIKLIKKKSPETEIFAMSALCDKAILAQLNDLEVKTFLSKPFEDIFQTVKTVQLALRCAAGHEGTGRS